MLLFVCLADKSYALVRGVNVTFNECKLNKEAVMVGNLVCQLRGVCFLSFYGNSDGGVRANESGGGFHVEESRTGGLDLSGEGSTLKGALRLEGLLMVSEVWRRCWSLGSRVSCLSGLNMSMI